VPTNCGAEAAAMAASRSTDLTSWGLMVTGARLVSAPSAKRSTGVAVRSWARALLRSCSSLVQPVSEVQ
jgi:hypothetical protein